MVAKKSGRGTTADPIQHKMTIKEACEIILEQGKVVEDVPDGWFTRTQLAEEWGCHHRSVDTRLRIATESGVVERKLFKTMIPNGKVCPIPHYRVAHRAE